MIFLRSHTLHDNPVIGAVVRELVLDDNGQVQITLTKCKGTDREECQRLSVPSEELESLTANLVHLVNAERAVKGMPPLSIQEETETPEDEDDA